MAAQLSTVARTDALPDTALDDALDRVRELSLRLWAVRAVHRPRRSLLGNERCTSCGEPHPCTTLRAVT